MTATDHGLFGPDSVTWRVHGHPSMLVGGLRALMLQALEPRAMAAVADHSGFRQDPWGRMRRTAEYVTTTTFGTTEAAEAAGRRVRAIHRRIRGVDPHTGLPYDASDVELLAWIHNVEVDSFLTAYRALAGPVTPADADRYVAEMSRAGELVGLPAGAVPATWDALQGYLALAPLEASPAARQAFPLLVAPPAPPGAPGFRTMWTSVVLTAVALLPDRARRAYRLRWLPPAAVPLRAGVGAFLRTAAATMGPSPLVVEAYERVGRPIPR